MSYIKKLQDIGLEKHEAEVYLACLKLGFAKVSELSREVDIPRTSIYVYIKNLIEKGYLKKTKKGNIEYFIPIDPKDILSNTKEKIESFAKVVPQLEKFMDFVGKKPKVEYFDTKQGLLNLYEKMTEINYKQPPYLIESAEAVKNGFEKMDWDFIYKLEKKFLDRKIVTQGLITKKTIPILKSMPENIKAIMRQRPATVRVIDDKEFPFSINLYLIYPDNVFIIVPQQNFVLTIEDKNIYSSLVSMYKTFFEKAEPFDIKSI